MRGRRYKGVVLTIFLAMLLILGAVLYAGCGGGSGDYTNAVLSEWAKLEDDADELVKAADSIEEEADLSDISDMFSEAVDNIVSFEDQLDGMQVPTEEEESHEALDNFLPDYEYYLASITELLDEVMGGNLDAEVPDFEALVDEARIDLEDYQDSQDYNPAELDEDVWDLGDTVLAVLFEFYGGEVR